MARARRRPVGGQRQDHRALVVRVGLAHDEARIGQGRGQAGHDRRGDHQAARDLGLGCGPIVSIMRSTLYCW